MKRERECKGLDDSGSGVAGRSVRLSGSGDPVLLEPRGILRPRWPRMTVRFLIVMVALAALATESGLVAWRLVTWRRRVDEHARTLNSARSFLYDSTRLREWHDAMRRKYERGLASPWLRVEPDPPPPP